MRVSSSVDAVEIGKKVICRDCQLFIIYNWQLVNGSITFNLDVLSLSSIIQFDGVYHNPADLQHLSQKKLGSHCVYRLLNLFPCWFSICSFFCKFFFFYNGSMNPLKNMSFTFVFGFLRRTCRFIIFQYKNLLVNSEFILQHEFNWNRTWQN